MAEEKEIHEEDQETVVETETVNQEPVKTTETAKEEATADKVEEKKDLEPVDEQDTPQADEMPMQESGKNADQKKKKPYGAAKPILVLMALLGILYFAAMGVSLGLSAQAGGYTPPVSEALMYFYQYNGAIVLAVLLLGIFGLTHGKHKGVLVKTFAWGVMITALIMAAPVFSQLYMLPQVDALTGFNFLVMYIPILCLVVAFVALLSQWNSKSRKTAGKLSIIAAAVAAGVTVYYGINVVDPAVTYEIFQYLQLVGILCANALMVLACVFGWYVGMKQEAFCAVVGIEQGIQAEAGEELECSAEITMEEV